MENGKHTIKTNFGLATCPETEITFYDCLRGNEQAKKTLESLKQAQSDMWDLMYEIEKIHPEYYESLAEVNGKMMSLKRDLQRQIDGFITY